MSYKGKYTVKNKEKYMGDYTKVRFLSLWELFFCRYLDNSPEVAKWNSEDCHIDYILECNNTQHYYMIDFYVIMKDGRKILFEIKPYKQTILPKKGKKVTRRYIGECFMYNKNLNKWKAARKFAELNGAEFIILTEKELKVLGMKTV